MILLQEGRRTTDRKTKDKTSSDKETDMCGGEDISKASFILLLASRALPLPSRRPGGGRHDLRAEWGYYRSVMEVICPSG
ncbi:unnamed protein product [Nezara viridula]|uniref:Uncharacterized protein n=1 Tax=Nezara viridula TaxID=85310 RepID=A0A9P0H634_NEZVI|nr:unnamed protein product [Nezara viridula]